MEILLIKIENEETLPLNEFFDYAGKCYALSKSREDAYGPALKMDDFFEASIRTKELSNVPVVFTTAEKEALVLGWYREAVIYKDVRQPSLFLEGNIIANSSDVTLLPKSLRKKTVAWQEKSKNYEIIEEEDRRYLDLLSYISEYAGENVFMRYPHTPVKLIPSATKSVEAVSEACEFYASEILNNTCQNLAEMKMLEAYGEKLTEMAPKSADGFYYMAMAQCQLGFAKKGIKNIEKALKLEPDASDLLAQKGLLLCSMDYNESAGECFAKAFEESHDESYLLMEGMAYLRNGNIDKGYELFKKLEDQTLLEDAGIDLKSLDPKNPFTSLSKLFLKIRA